MTRHITLVDFYWTRDKDPRIPLGQASLYASLAKRTDVEVKRITIPVNAMKRDVQGISKEILSHCGARDPRDADLAIGVYVWAEEIVQRLLPLVRKMGFKGRIILGGPQLTYMGSGLEAIYPDADVFVRGYGENALCELVQDAGKPLIPGVHYAGRADLCTQANVDLEALPSPWLSGVIPVERQRFIRWETQRGCNFRCAFCQHREAGERLSRRELGEKRIFREIDLFCDTGIEEIAVLDPVFNMGQFATPVLERFVERGYRGRLSLQCRAETTTERFLDAAHQLDVCLEFGLQTIHKNEQKAIRRGNAMKRVDETIRKVRERGIDFEVSLIFGLPEQTLDSFKASVDWCLRRQVPVLKAFPLMLLRGTALDEQREQWGLVEDGSAMPKVIASNSFSHTEWREMAKISEALKKTEGHHPSSVTELMQWVVDAEIDSSRWQPTS